MDAHASLQGWEPSPTDDLPLSRIVDLAFDYRGDVTIAVVGGAEVVGYVFDRDGAAREPFLQMLRPGHGEPTTIPYAQITAIRFTGKDTAFGKSHEVWKQRREQESRKPQPPREHETRDGTS